MVGIAALWVMAGAAPCRAEEYHSEKHGYRLRTPDGWVRVPDKAVQELLRSMLGSNTGASAIVYDAAFQRRSPRWWTYPYVIVQPLSYEHAGRRGQIGEDQFESVMRQQAAASVPDTVGSTASNEVSRRITRAEASEPVLDKTNRRFTYFIDTELKNFGTVRTHVMGYFGNKAMVQIIYACPMNDSEKTSAERQAIFDSFRFDAGAAYNENQSMYNTAITVGWVVGIGAGMGVLILAYRVVRAGLRP